MLDLYHKFGIIINNAVSFYMWNLKIYHNIKINQWHIYTGNRYLPPVSIYPYNKKELFRNTIYEYAPIKEFKQKYEYYDDFKILQIAGYQSFELLWKMGLYRLSLSAKYFNKKGSFQKRFGVPKSFLNFMVKNNIDYEQYKVLKLLQEPNLQLINYYKRYNYNYLVFMKKQGYLKNKDIVENLYSNEKEIREICKYMPLRKFLNYEKGVKNIYLYVDYLDLLKKLNYKMKCRKELFPTQLKSMHDKLMKKIKIQDDYKTKSAVYLRFLELSKYIYDDGNYFIFPAPSVEDLKDEGKQQNNCVARTYLPEYSENRTEIFFIRKLDNINKSLITLEFRDGKVRQKELANNNTKLTKEQNKFIENWVLYRQFIDKKQQYTKQSKSKNVEYKLKKLVA